MTRQYRGLVTCPECGAVHTAEAAFERWMRNEPLLDSREIGLVRYDGDLILHRYKVVVDKKSRRDIQCLMFVEVKTFNAEPSTPQRDTLSLMAQVLRNRRRNRHADKRGLHALEHDPLCVAFSWLQGRAVRLKMYGGHLLQLDADDPVTSTQIRWNHKDVTHDQLIALLRFELDPNTLCPVDWRRRYSNFPNDTMFPDPPTP